MDIFTSPDPVTPFLSLCVHHRVQIIVIEHNRVRLNKIDASGTTVRGKDGTEDALVSVENLHQLLHEQKKSRE